MASKLYKNKNIPKKILPTTIKCYDRKHFRNRTVCKFFINCTMIQRKLTRKPYNIMPNNIMP